jgi:hypothetical protein
MAKKQPPLPPLEAGTYRARVVSIVVDERYEKPTLTRTGITRTAVSSEPIQERKYTRRANPDSKYDPKAIWTFAVLSGGGDTVTLTGRTSQKLSDQAQATPWAQAIMNRPFQPREPFDTDNLEGRWCRVTVKTKKGSAFVVDVLPRDWE